MKTLLFALFALFTLFALPALAAEDEAAPTPIDFGSAETLSIETQNGAVNLMVEIADTDEERARGLMYRTTLGDKEGMLFDFKTPQPVSFWMKNTLIPLDLIFIGADGHIVSIARNARPKSTRHIPSGGSVLAVLEIGGGRARQLGIERGDVVHQKLFGNAADTQQGLPAPAQPPKSADE